MFGCFHGFVTAATSFVTQLERQGYDWDCIHRIWEDFSLLAPCHYVLRGAREEASFWSGGRTFWPNHLPIGKDILM